MNTHPENNFDFFEPAPGDSFLYSTEVHPLTYYITIEHAIMAFRVLFGKEVAGTSDLVLEDAFGAMNPDLIDLYFQHDKLQLRHEVELGITTRNFLPIDQDDQPENVINVDNIENGDDEDNNGEKEGNNNGNDEGKQADENEDDVKEEDE